MLSAILNWLLSGPLDRMLKSVDSAVDNETTREQIKSELVKTFLSAQVSVLTGRGWWFPLFFVAPAGFWFASVCVYSVFWCRDCVFSQPWTIAALPPPLDGWVGGAIIGSLFVGKAGGEIISRLRR